LIVVRSEDKQGVRQINPRFAVIVCHTIQEFSEHLPRVIHDETHYVFVTDGQAGKDIFVQITFTLCALNLLDENADFVLAEIPVMLGRFPPLTLVTFMAIPKTHINIAMIRSTLRASRWRVGETAPEQDVVILPCTEDSQRSAFLAQFISSIHTGEFSVFDSRLN
jgi:hypothetical protein